MKQRSAPSRSRAIKSSVSRAVTSRKSRRRNRSRSKSCARSGLCEATMVFTRRPYHELERVVGDRVRLPLGGVEVPPLRRQPDETVARHHLLEQRAVLAG